MYRRNMQFQWEIRHIKEVKTQSQWASATSVPPMCICAMNSVSVHVLVYFGSFMHVKGYCVCVCLLFVCGYAVFLIPQVGLSLCQESI